MSRAEIYQGQPPEEGTMSRIPFYADSLSCLSASPTKSQEYMRDAVGLPPDAYQAALHAHRMPAPDDGAYLAEAYEPTKPATGAEDIVYGAWVVLRIALWIGTPLATIVAGLWLFRGALS